MANNSGRGWFQKGVSGNPSGRPTEAVDVARLCRQYGEAAVERLIEIMNGNDPKLALRAAEAVLARGYGSAVEFREMTLRNGETDDERRERIQAEAKAMIAALASRETAKKAGRVDDDGAAPASSTLQ